MKFEELVIKFEKLIANDRTEEAIVLLLDNIDRKNCKDLYNSILLISGRYHKFKQKEHRGIEDKESELNSIRHDLIELADNNIKNCLSAKILDNKVVNQTVPKVNNAGLALDNTPHNKKLFKILGAIFIAGGVLAAIVAFLLPKFWPENTPPSAIIIARPDMGNLPLKVTLDGNSSNDPEGKPLIYEWKIRDSVVSKFSQLEYEFFKTGDFTVILKVTDIGGLFNSESTIITVFDTTIAESTSKGIRTIDSPENIETETLHIQKTLDEDSKLEGEKQKFYTDMIISTVWNKAGKPLSGVKVWCSNCTDRSETITDEKGAFTLSISTILIDQDIQQLEICFAYADRKECLLSHYKYVSGIIAPQF